MKTEKVSPGKKAVRKKNEFHLRVAMYHLQQISADAVPVDSIQEYIDAMKGIEELASVMLESA